MPVPRSLSPATERDFLWHFAYSEADSESRHGDKWRSELGPALVSRLASGDHSALSAEDLDRLRTALLAVRGHYIGSLLDFRPEWHFSTFDLDGLSGVQLLRIPAFSAHTPSRRLGDFVTNLDAGKDTAPDRFAERYWRLGPHFDPDRSRGCPMLVGPSRSGPFTEIDGLTRMALLLSRRTKGQAAPSELQVLLGLSPRIIEWPFF